MSKAEPSTVKEGLAGSSFEKKYFLYTISRRKKMTQNTEIFLMKKSENRKINEKSGKIKNNKNRGSAEESHPT
jgi:hypothetical protein